MIQNRPNTSCLHKNSYKIAVLIFALITPFIFYAQAGIGMKAPELHLEGIYNSGTTTFNPESLKGKIVVLDFWATWCSPCVAAFPENNELYSKYKSKDVVFIAITDDPKEKLDNFLKKGPIDFWVGRDDDKQDFLNYQVIGRPAMFIINRDGTIVYRSNHLEEEKLLEVINTNGIITEDASGHPEVIVNGGFRGGEDPLYNGMKQMTGKKTTGQSELIDQLIIRPSLENNQSGSFAYRMKKEHVGITYSCGSLEEISVFLHDLQSGIWVENQVHDTCRYDIVYWRKNDNFERAIEEIEEGLSRGLSICLDSVSHPRNINVLSLNQLNQSVKTPEQIEEGTEKLYTPVTLFLTRLEDLTGQFHIAHKSLKDMQIENQGMEWKKLYEADAKTITDFLKSKGIVIKQETQTITSYVIRKK